MNKTYFFVGIAIFLLVGAGIYAMFFLTNAPTHIEKVVCYDRQWNEINGLDCDEKVYDDPFARSLDDFREPIAMFVLLGSVIGILLICVSFVEGWIGER